MCMRVKEMQLILEGKEQPGLLGPISHSEKGVKWVAAGDVELSK